MTGERPTSGRRTRLTRRVKFAASHRLFNPSFDEAKNDRIFGQCNNPNGHGHNYTLEVTVEGEIDPETGMVVNLKDLKQILADRVVTDCDHRHLNLDVPWLEGTIPTAENLAVRFWERLADEVAPARLHRVRVFESEDNVAEYYGEPNPRA